MYFSSVRKTREIVLQEARNSSRKNSTGPNVTNLLRVQRLTKLPSSVDVRGVMNALYPKVAGIVALAALNQEQKENVARFSIKIAILVLVIFKAGELDPFKPFNRQSPLKVKVIPRTMPNQTPHPIPNRINDPEHYAMAYNVATVSSSPWYNYETQKYDYHGEQVEAGNSKGIDSWGMEGRSGNNQFDPSQESYPTYSTWDSSVSFTEPQSHIADDGFQQH
ncbi:MAG: hypothetical protein NXY57DRAFT_1037803 [Lentinula lateritia]|nr:MAG: hypothetical protein NXY57DRAFT_1037803 [Lentinula lateritia]